MALPAGSVQLELILDSTKFYKAMDGLKGASSKATSGISKNLSKTSKAYKVLSTTGKIALKGLGLSLKATGALTLASCKVMAKGFSALRGIVGLSFGLMKGFMLALIPIMALWKNGMEDLLAGNNETANKVRELNVALDNLGRALATATAPILNVAIPALTKLINWLTKCATAVAHFTSAITGRKTVLVASKQAKSYGKSLGGVGKKAQGASKDVKELQRSLMGFDKINKLDAPNKNNGSGGSKGGSSGSAGAVNAGGGFKSVPVEKWAYDLSDKLKDAWKKADFTWLGKTLAEKLNKAMASIPWDKIKKGAWRIAHSLGTFINGFVENFDWKLLGKTVSEGVLTIFTFVSTFLETVHWQSIGKAIVEYISGIQWGKLFKASSRIVGNIAGAIAGIFWGALKTAYGKIKEYFRTQLKKAGKSGIEGFFYGIWIAIKGIGKFIVNKIFKPFIKGFKKAFGIASPSKVMKKQGGYVIDGMLKGIKDKFKSVIDWFKDMPKKIIDAIKSKAEGLEDAISEQMGDVKEAVTEAFGKAMDFVVDIKAKVATKWNDIKEDWAKAISGVKDKTADMKAQVATVWNDLKKKWKNAISGIKSKTANMRAKVASKWSDLKTKWNNLKAKFKGKTADMKAKIASKWSDFKDKWKRLLGNFKGKTAKIKLEFVDKLKKGYNTIAEKIQAARKRWPATKVILPDIHPLAQGGWLKKNTPRLAVVGDNRHEGEIVSPESKLMAMARQASQEAVANSGANAQALSLLTKILQAIQSQDTNVYLDGEQIKNNTVRRINNHTRATGQLEIIL